MDSAVHEFNIGEGYNPDQFHDETSNEQIDLQNDQTKNFFNENQQQMFQKELSPKLDPLNDTQVKQQMNNGLNNFIQDLTDSTIPLNFNNQNDIMNNEYDNNNKIENNEKHNTEYLHDEVLDNDFTTEMIATKEGHDNDLGPETCVDFANDAGLITDNCENSLDPSTAPLDYINPLDNKTDVLDPNHNDFFKNQQPEKINENSNQLFSPDSEEVINQYSDDTMNMLSSDDQHTEPLSLEQQSINNDVADLLNKDIIGEIIDENELLKEFNDNNLQQTNGYTSNANDFNANEIGNLEDFGVTQNLENHDEIPSELIIEKNQELTDQNMHEENIPAVNDNIADQLQNESLKNINEDFCNDKEIIHKEIDDIKHKEIEFDEKDFKNIEYDKLDQVEEQYKEDLDEEIERKNIENKIFEHSENDFEPIENKDIDYKEHQNEILDCESIEQKNLDLQEKESEEIERNRIEYNENDHYEKDEIRIEDKENEYEEIKNKEEIKHEKIEHSQNEFEETENEKEKHQEDETEKIINEISGKQENEIKDLEFNEKCDDSPIEMAECDVINNDNKAVYQNDDLMTSETKSDIDRISLSNENLVEKDISLNNESLVENNFSNENIPHQDNLEHQENFEIDNQTSQIEINQKTIEENILKEDLEQNIKLNPTTENQLMESSESKVDKNLDGKHLEPPPNDKCDESDDEWDYINVKENEGEKQETENSEKGIINASVDKLLIDQSLTEKDNIIDEKIKESDNKNPSEIVTQSFDIDFEKIAETDDMNYQLNPDAKEFIPTSPPDFAALTNGYPKLQQRFEDDVVAQSPRKASVNMEDIQVPEESTFDKEAAQRPHEVAEELIMPEQAPIPCGIKCGDENRHICEESENGHNNVFDVCAEKENSVENSIVTTTANADPLVGFSPVAELDNIDMNRSIYIENSSSKTEKDESDLLNSVQTIPDEIENANEVAIEKDSKELIMSPSDALQSPKEIEEVTLNNVIEDINNLNINSEDTSKNVEQQIQENVEKIVEPLEAVKNDVIEVSNNSQEIIDVASAAVATAAVVAIKAVTEKSKLAKSPTTGATKTTEVKKSLSKTSASDPKKPISAVSQKKVSSATTAKPKTMTVAATQPPKTLIISPPKRPQTAPVRSNVLTDKKLGTSAATKTTARPQSAGLTKKVAPTTTVASNKTGSEPSTLKGPSTTRPAPNKNTTEIKSTVTKSSPSTLKSKTVKSPLNGVAPTNAAPRTLLVNKTGPTTKTSTFKAAPPRTITSSAPTKTETNKSPTTKTVTKITSRPIASAPKTIGVTKRVTSSTTTTTSKPSEINSKKLESTTTTTTTTVRKTLTSSSNSTNAAAKKSTKPPLSSTTTKKTVSATAKLSPTKNQNVGKISEKKVIENETQLINNIETNNIPLEVVENTPNLNNGDNNCVTEIIKEDILA
ncbi:putative uncharacterized protein DDB_G0282133 isoform X2 [Condylostylus longicornis]|nr:putative uncharacterized protein DDB_G0282133 isoform X2 [Condylostylus longicornis]